MRYPRILKSPSLTSVFNTEHPHEGYLWQQRVNEIFGAKIALHVESATSTHFSSCVINPLEKTVLEELSNILQHSKSSWKFWTVELVEKTIPKLVRACIWKNDILSESTYYRDTVAKHAAEGIEILSGLPEYFMTFANDSKKSTRSHLVNKYLEAPYSEGDSKAIIIRALRCFVTYRINKKNKSELLFKFCPDLSLSIRAKFIDKYLYEQLCLYIYLFRNPEEAHFFLERRQQLVNFVSARLPNNHEEIAEVIVGETFDYLIKRRNTYNRQPDEIWMDTSLDTFFIGNILSSKRIQRFREKHRKIEGQFTNEEEYGEYEQDLDNISVRPKQLSPALPAHTSSKSDEKGRLLRQYIEKLDPTCKSYFQWEFFGMDPKEKKELHNTQLDTVEKPCLKKIKNILLNNGYYDLFVK